MSDSDTRGWKRSPDRYWKDIGQVTYGIFEGGYYGKFWYVRHGLDCGKGYVGEYRLLSDAKRAAHAHARETK